MKYTLFSMEESDDQIMNDIVKSHLSFNDSETSTKLQK